MIHYASYNISENMSEVLNQIDNMVSTFWYRMQVLYVIITLSYYWGSFEYIPTEFLIPFQKN